MYFVRVLFTILYALVFAWPVTSMVNIMVEEGKASFGPMALIIFVLAAVVSGIVGIALEEQNGKTKRRVRMESI